MVHGNARLTPGGWRILVERIEVEGWPVAVAAESMGVSRKTTYRWLRRYRTQGVAGLVDRLHTESAEHQPAGYPSTTSV